jgi:hypothetical protein
VTGTLRSDAGRPDDGLPTALSQRILDALVDEHGADLSSPQPCMWLFVRKRGLR